MFRRVLFACGLLLFTGAAAPATQATFPCVDDAMDLNGDPSSADLVIFAGGNQWFVMPDLISAFQLVHQDVHSVYYETLPPGILAGQLQSGALQVGGFTLRVRADVFLAPQRLMSAEQSSGLVGDPVTYASNGIAIMVRAGNPKHITSLTDLGRPDVRVAMPNPLTEGIARQIVEGYRQAGGAALEQTIMTQKVNAGTTIMTSIHHRQTPMWLLDGRVDAGPVWISEALYQERIHSGLIAVRIPDAENFTGLYLGAAVTGAPHPAAAREFVEFLNSPTAAAIYRSYGFGPPGLTEDEHG
jgi:ABC-type molybdate transport system substrate-binding protein